MAKSSAKIPKYRHYEGCKCAVDDRIYKKFHPEHIMKASSENQLKTPEKPVVVQPERLEQKLVTTAAPQAGSQAELNGLLNQIITPKSSPPPAPPDSVSAQPGLTKPADIVSKPSGAVELNQPPPPPPPPGTSTETKSAVVDTRQVIAAQAATVLKAPFNISNAIFKTDKFVLDDKELDALVQQFINLSNLFGWDKVLTEAKWIALLVFFVSYGGAWMSCFNRVNQEKQKIKEGKADEPKQPKPPEVPKTISTETKQPDDPLKGFPKAA